jgi:hypothetical protein
MRRGGERNAISAAPNRGCRARRKAAGADPLKAPDLGMSGGMGLERGRSGSDSPRSCLWKVGMRSTLDMEVPSVVSDDALSTEFVKVDHVDPIGGTDEGRKPDKK